HRGRRLPPAGGSACRPRRAQPHPQARRGARGELRDVARAAKARARKAGAPPGGAFGYRQQARAGREELDFMSYTVRDLLEILAESHGREPLNALLDKRGLDRGRAFDEKMTRLARSDRGDVEAFLDDLRVSDLRTIAQDRLELRRGMSTCFPERTG